MKIVSGAETLEIHKGVQFVEMAIRNIPIFGMEAFEAIEDPRVTTCSDGNLYEWRGKSLKTGEIVRFAVCDGATGYAPKLYPIEHPLVQAFLQPEDRKETPPAKETPPKPAPEPEEKPAESAPRHEADEKPQPDAATPAPPPEARTAMPETPQDFSTERDGKGFTLVNHLTGKRRQFVTEDGHVLVDDKDIDYEAIRRQFKNCHCLDTKESRYHFGIWSHFKDGINALSWTLYPDGRYFEDEGGFGGDSNDEEKVYCIVNTDFDILVPFRPMKDVKEELRRVAEKLRGKRL